MATTLTSSSRALDRLYSYPEEVLSGEIVTCDKVQKACRRFKRELDRSLHDEGYPWKFDERLAVRPIEFMERFLVPTKGQYNSMTLMPWQCFAEGNMYGWVSKDTGLRRFREALIVVGKGNGKTTLLAGNATYGVSKDDERGAEVYLLANSKEQAGHMYSECFNQIKGSPLLTSKFRALRDGIHYDPTNGVIAHRASDSKKLDGLNPHMAVFDEIHEYRDGKLINTIRRSMIKRRQPLCIYITTMGNVIDPQAPLIEYYSLFSDVLEEDKRPAIVADRLFTLIYELDSPDEIEKPEFWVKANPGIGTVLDLDELVAEWERCKPVPGDKSVFLNKQLNFLTDVSDAAYLDFEVLKKNDRVIPTESLLGRTCYGGFDLSTREDFTSAALEFELDDGSIFFLHHSWIPKKKVLENNEKIEYYEWAMKGYLTIVDEDFIDQNLIYEWFKAQAEKYEILTIGYDQANAIWLVRRLEADGFKCEIVRQGPITLNDPMKDLREKFLAGKVISNRDELLRWYTGNVRLRNDFRDRDKENWMPVKKNRYRKIDGFMACLDAHTVAMWRAPIHSDVEPSITFYSL